MRNIRILSK